MEKAVLKEKYRKARLVTNRKNKAYMSTIEPEFKTVDELSPRGKAVRARVLAEKREIEEQHKKVEEKFNRIFELLNVK
ncbi:hypothetical protein ACFWAE_21105 [Priestia megaterium]|uniref:hypothetical protein n=1 Tax=Priestia megaterium TaxID=1404 RepID=UPI00366D4C03